MANWGPLEFIRRAFTAPASANSVSDILGPEKAKVLTGLLKDAVSLAANNALTILAENVGGDIAYIKTTLSTRIVKALPNMTPSIQGEINAQIDNVFTGVTAVAVSDITKLAQAVSDGIGKVFGG